MPTLPTDQETIRRALQWYREYYGTRGVVEFAMQECDGALSFVVYFSVPKSVTVEIDGHEYTVPVVMDRSKPVNVD